MATALTSSADFPIDPEALGNEMITIEVGKGDSSRTYTMHKGVLCKASKYFVGALQRGFKESLENKVMLPEHDPLAFALLCDYLYSGAVRNAEYYTKGRIPSDVLWLRTFKLADATMIHSLVVIAYDRLIDAFNTTEYQVPSSPFAHELFHTDYPQDKLADYIVQHAAFCIWAGLDKEGWEPWTKIIDSVNLFGTHLARHLTKLCRHDYTGPKMHPSTISQFNTDTMFPNPVEPVKAEPTLFGSVVNEVQNDDRSDEV